MYSRWSVARTACRLWNRPDKPERREVQPVDKCLNEPHRVISSDVVVNCFWQQQQLGAVVAEDMWHAGILPRQRSHRNPLRPSFHTVCKTFEWRSRPSQQSFAFYKRI